MSSSAIRRSNAGRLRLSTASSSTAACVVGGGCARALYYATMQPLSVLPMGARWHLMGAQRQEQAVAFLMPQPRPCADACRPSPLSGLCWQNKGGGPQC